MSDRLQQDSGRLQQDADVVRAAPGTAGAHGTLDAVGAHGTGGAPGTHGTDFVLGVDVGGTKVAVATADRAGRILRQTRIETEASRGARQTVDRALRVAERLRAETAAATGGRCLGVGAASPGVVHDNQVLLAPNIPGWEELSLPALLREGLGIDRVAAANDVKAGGLAEARWGALRDADPGIYLNVGTGLAAALIVGGRVLGGAHEAAGEIGYLLRGPADRAGAASGRAPLEEYISGMGLARRGAELLGGAPTAADLFASSDPRAQALVSDALDQLAVHVANVATVLDPQRIAVGGGMMSSGPRVLAALEARVRESVPFPPQVVASAFPHDSALRGALAVILDDVGVGAVSSRAPR